MTDHTPSLIWWGVADGLMVRIDCRCGWVRFVRCEEVWEAGGVWAGHVSEQTRKEQEAE